MRHAFRFESFKSGRHGIGCTGQFSKLSARRKENITLADSGTNPSSILFYSSRTTETNFERQAKDKLLAQLIQKSEEKPFSISRAIEDRMAPDTKRSRTRSYAQFITTPTADTPGTALVLCFDDRRYLIGNMHEGLQRAGLGVGAKFFRAKDFFLTGKTEWRSNGGLLGMLLTLADSSRASAESKAENTKLKLERKRAREEEWQQHPGKKRQTIDPAAPESSKSSQIVEEEDTTVTFHGGPNLTHTIATARSFIFRHGTPVKVIENHEGTSGRERNWEPTWEDERVQVWAMAISPESDDGNLRSVSPRKRSLGEYMSGQGSKPDDIDDQWSVHPKVSLDQEKRDQQIREFVVSEMFSSTWRYDNLVEKPLHEVVMPAALFTRDPQTRKIVKYQGPVPDGTTPLPNITILVRQPWPGALVDHLPATKPSSVAMCYIFRNHKQRGKFKPEAARAFKVPPGPLWAALARGSEVQSNDGKTIAPDMVLEPNEDGNGVAVVELPSHEYIRDLVNRPEWNEKKIMTGVCSIMWILGPGVSENENLREFMKSKSDLKHIISSSDHCPNYLVQTAAATAALRHNQIDPARFPILVHSNATLSPLNKSIDDSASDVEQGEQRPIPALRGLRIDLQPSFGITEEEVIPYLNTALVLQETPKDVLTLAQAARQKAGSRSLEKGTASQPLPSQDAEIICLGTGSAMPSLHRNVSGTLLRVPGHGSYLLDCGENTLGQLKRMFTESELAEILHDLKLIWISHLHADHHLGTTSVIRAWYEEVHGREPTKSHRPTLTEQLLEPAKFLQEGKRLLVVAHGHMLRWLEEYSSVEDFGYDQLVPVRSYPAHFNQPDSCQLEWNGLNVGFSSNDPKIHAAIRKATSLSNLVTVPVSHCYGAQAISLTFPNGFKFSYSGDCRPSKAFAITGKDSTVLLHEATFDDELVGDAVAKKHSTTSEAIGVGVAMGAKRVLLTHFSQRYQKIPGSNSMSNLRVQLEDAEETEDPMEGIEPPVNAEDEGATDLLAPKTDLTGVYRDKTQDTTATPAFVSLNSMTNLSRPPTNDMKVGVAFDHMRVKVGDIEHLECFTPALRELYKEEEKKDARGKRAAKEAFSDNLQDIKPSKASASGAREDSQKAPEAKKGSQKPSKNEKKGQKKSDSFFRKQPQNGMEDAHVESTTARLDAEENLISPPETRRLNEDTQVQEEGPRIRRDNPEEIPEKTPSPKRPTTSLEGGEDATLPPPPHDSTTASKEQTHTASPSPPQDPPGNVPTPPETGEDAASPPIRRYRSGGIQGEDDAGSAPIRRYGSQGI